MEKALGGRALSRDRRAGAIEMAVLEVPGGQFHWLDKINMEK